MLGPSRTVDGPIGILWIRGEEGNSKEKKSKKWYIHLHILKLLPLALPAEEGGGAVLDETSLAFAETRDIGRNKVLGRDALGRTLFGRAGSSRGGPLGGNETRRVVHGKIDPGSGLWGLWLGSRRDRGRRVVEDLVSGNAHLLVRVRIVRTESSAEHHGSGDGRLLLRACRAHGVRRSGRERVLELEAKAVEGRGGREAGVVPVVSGGGEEGGVVGEEVSHVEGRDNVHGRN